MDDEEMCTPQRLSHKIILNYQAQNQQQSSVSPCQFNKMTPKNSERFKKSLNPRTPKQSISYSVATCSSVISSNSSSTQSISMAVVQTPPAKRYHGVKNPFEAALAERLHLPIIASPSMFQRPNTPQLSSTQFEWTIDDLSSLKPANVEAHETQFQDSPDPDLEAKAQLAISSYFKEHKIVPSPIDCPLRSQRIFLSEINGNTPLSKPGRRIRDCSSQTELTLPPILPPALEAALKPYFQPHLAGTNQELNKSTEVSKMNQLKDTSLRRKLFDMHNVVVLDNENQKTPKQQTTKGSNNSAHSNSSPISVNSLQHTAIVGKLSDSSDKSSFGSLSPISARDSLSPNCPMASATKRKTRFGSFINEAEIEMLSPIHPPARRKPFTEISSSEYRQQNLEFSKSDMNGNNNCNENEENQSFTPERSSSPLNIMLNNNIAEFSADSFNIKISRLKVNSSKTQMNGQERIKSEHKGQTEVDIFLQDDTEDMLENTGDMDEMQVSQMSGHSSNCSSSQSDTPRSKRRSASRKNLSQSFSANWLEDEDEEEPDISHSVKIKEILAKKQIVANSPGVSKNLCDDAKNQIFVNNTPKKNLGFYRTDSGFNELSQNSLSSYDAAKSQDVKQLEQQKYQQEVGVCCSTPSKNDNFDLIS